MSEFQLTLKIGHISPHVRVERVDHHLPVRRARDLDAAVHEARGGRRALPRGVLADVPGLWQEVGQGTLVELGLAELSPLEEVLACGVEGAVEEGDEGEGLGRQDLLVLLLDGAEHTDALEDVFHGSHGCGFVCVYGV